MVEHAEYVAKELFSSGSNDVTFYVLMANMYFEAGMLEDAERIRVTMKEMDLKKTTGHSLVCTGRERIAVVRYPLGRLRLRLKVFSA
ncbi:hypothetical protein ABZP36_008542 [Zizania latifolia]